ncbi:YbjN domain-containing protein [Rhodovulum sp. DZ06]|uniref:YbjN domain-containing protein n=1 Tax=Rhodovulum sp. DZ06 TaxID=3425126 RepID=UPI003D34320A
MIPRRTALAAALALLCAPAAQGADLIAAADPDGVVAAMQRLGYRAMLDVDNVGDPMIRSASSRIEFEVLFYDCDDGRACRALQFSAGFDLEDAVPMELLNQWNASHRFGAAFRDEEGDPFLQYDVTTLGGLTEENFADIVDWWRVALSGFAEHVDYRP